MEWNRKRQNGAFDLLDQFAVRVLLFLKGKERHHLQFQRILRGKEGDQILVTVKKQGTEYCRIYPHSQRGSRLQPNNSESSTTSQMWRFLKRRKQAFQIPQRRAFRCTLQTRNQRNRENRQHYLISGTKRETQP